MKARTKRVGFFDFIGKRCGNDRRKGANLQVWAFFILTLYCSCLKAFSDPEVVDVVALTRPG